MITASIIKKVASIIIFLIIEGLVAIGTVYGAELLHPSGKDKILARKVTAVICIVATFAYIVVTIID